MRLESLSKVPIPTRYCSESEAEHEPQRVPNPAAVGRSVLEHDDPKATAAFSKSLRNRRYWATLTPERKREYWRRQTGNRRSWEEECKRRQETARRFAEGLLPLVEEIRTEGITTLQGIARELTRRKVQTGQSKPSWSATQVKHLLTWAGDGEEGRRRVRGRQRDPVK